MKILKTFWGSKSTFIQGSTQLHKDSFTYENLDLESYPKIKGICCTIHGEFSCNIRTHVKGDGGCKKCQYEKLQDTFKATKESYKDLLPKGKHILSFNNRKDFVVSCEGHGDYKTNEEALRREFQGCPSCKEDGRLKESLKYHQKKITELYDGVCKVYKDSLIYTCNLHNIDTKVSVKTASSAINSGVELCKLCSTEKKRKLHAWTQEYFIQLSRNKYKDMFTYEKLEYTNSTTKITLACKHHGDFQVYPNSHIRGVTGGCKECEKLNTQASTWKNIKKALRGDYGGKDTYFYICRFYSDSEEFFKIGVARSGAKKRYAASKYREHYNVDIVSEYKMTEFRAVLLEHMLLTNYGKYTPCYKFCGYTECFNTISPVMKKVINNYTKQEEGYE